MEFARKVWKLLVALKDGLALILLLLFFVALYAVLSFRPSAGEVREGALLLSLNGTIVEEPSKVDPVAFLLSGEVPTGEFRSRDVVRALRRAAKDDRIKAVVLDLSGFVGSGFVHLQDVGAALDAVRAAGKPVLTYAVAYVDDGVYIAAHSSEVWLDPMGGAFVTGPGGNNLYYGRLLEKLNITAHVYRVGTFKSAVEPWIRNDPSDAAREAYQALYGAIWRDWKADVAKARPKAAIERVAGDPVAWLEASGGNTAQASKDAGLVDRIGSKTEFGLSVAEIVGKSTRETGLGAYAHTEYDAWLAADSVKESGKAIGVITIAGEIVDGDAGPGVAGGDRITRLLDEAIDRDFAALVVRVDSPGGSIIASEQIRRAIDRYRQRGIPVIVSMANLAASGGYWVSTPAQHIFAEPATITGSIGVFAILPTFDRALADLGVTGGGVKTTPLSGQPDILTGLAPEVSAMIQANVESSYARFIGLVGRSRGQSPEKVDEIAQGRPWAGGAARRFGLVDEFGGLDAALAYAARTAKLADGDWHAEYLGDGEDRFVTFLRRMQRSDGTAAAKGRDWAGIAAERQSALVALALRDVERLLSVRGVQAYCLECPRVSEAVVSRPDPTGEVSLLARLLGLRAE